MIGRKFLLTTLASALFALASFAQPPVPKQPVRTVTIPISIFTKTELKENQIQEYVQIERLNVKEDKDDQAIISIRSVSDSPMSIAFVIQEDLSSNFNLQIKDIQDFIRRLPSGTRVMVAYSRSGTIQVRQRFTDDRHKAASSLRIVAGSEVFAPGSPSAGHPAVPGWTGPDRCPSAPPGRCRTPRW